MSPTPALALLALTPFLPLVLALAMVPQPSRRLLGLLLPLAPLPALGAALLLPPGEEVRLPLVLLGLDLGLDAKRRLLLLVTALLWLAAAIYSRGYLGGRAGRARYEAFFLVTMGGNLGLIVALDVPGFYLFFSLMTLASYILVVFEGSERAHRAGRAYILLSILGETALLLGFLRATAAAGSLSIAEVPAALAEGEAATLLLLFAGFAIKAGQLPLHVWLPLAHSAAPTPASAVLSGAMIKAGLLGMVLFLPLGEAALPDPGLALAGLGIATAFYGVFCGLSQEDPKTILAYSSLSQMGLLVAALGVVLAAPVAAPLLLPAVLLYAAHHGLSKAALFLAVGVVRQADGGRLAALAVAAVAAAAIAGAPLTAGALAKLLLKQAAEAGAEVRAGALLLGLLSASAVATGLLMLRFLARLGVAAAAPAERPGAGALLWLPFLAVALLGQLLPWMVAVSDRGGAVAGWGSALAAYGLWESAWPPLLALLLLLLWRGLRRAGLPAPPAVPEGDWLALLPDRRTSLALWLGLYRRTAFALRRRPALLAAATLRVTALPARLESGLLARAPGALALLLLAAALVLSLLQPF